MADILFWFQYIVGAVAISEFPETQIVPQLVRSWYSLHFPIRFENLYQARHYQCRALYKIAKRLGNWEYVMGKWISWDMASRWISYIAKILYLLLGVSAWPMAKQWYSAFQRKNILLPTQKLRHVPGGSGGGFVVNKVLTVRFLRVVYGWNFKVSRSGICHCKAI